MDALGGYERLRDKASRNMVREGEPSLGEKTLFLLMGFIFYLARINQFTKDVPEPWQLSLQDAAHPVMEEIIFFHDQVMFMLTMIITTVL